MDTNELNEYKGQSILAFLQWNDRHGCYTDAVKFFFGVMNEDFYYSKVDNIFELTYEEVIEYAKQNGFYDRTMEKLQLLLQESSPNDSFYRSLI